MSDQKLTPDEREAIAKTFDPTRYATASGGQMEATKLRILLSIDQRLEDLGIEIFHMGNMIREK